MRSTLSGLLFASLLVVIPAQAFVWPNQIDRIERQLHDEDVAVRRGAARQIGDLPVSVSGKLALLALADPDPEVRLAAVEAAVLRAPERAAAIVVPWLSDADPRLRLAAARALALAPDDRAIAALGRVLSDPDAEVREAAARALGLTASPEASRMLLGRLDDPVPLVRAVVIEALARLGDPGSVVPLLGKVQDPTLSVRWRVVRALGELGDARAASSLLIAMQDADPTVRAEAVSALGRLGVAAVVPSLVSALRAEEEGEVRRRLVAALAALGSEAAVDALIESLGDPGPGLTVADLAAALSAAGDAATVRLERCRGGQPEATQARGGAEALGAVGGPRAAVALTAALRRGVLDPDAALSALGRAGEASALPVVLEHLAAPVLSTRLAAADAAWALLDPKRPDGRAAAPIARALVAARTPEERLRLARLLGRTGAPAAVPALVPLVRSNDDLALRIAAIEALGDVAPAGQDRVLIEALDDASGAARWSAAVALWRSASGAAARVLLDRLEVAAARDRGLLALALGGALSRNRDPGLVVRAAALTRQARDGERDALLEALGRAPGPKAGALVAGFGRAEASVQDRAKVAEALGTHADALRALRQLLTDPDGAVRANAAWSLGSVGDGSDVPRLRKALDDPDVAVAGNAAAALARLSRRTRAAVGSALCATFAAPRAYVRANALVGASLVGERCDPAIARRLLLTDASPVVRRAAATLLLRVPAADGRADQVALRRCGEQDGDGAVAAQCASPPPPVPELAEPVAVYVIPAAEPGPVARAPFALMFADGLLRLGVSDRRGVVFEAAAPRGAVSLEVPAPLER